MSKLPQQGDVVLVPFPFTDLTGTKVRPAIVVNKDKQKGDSVYVFVTTKIKPQLRGEELVVIPDNINGLKEACQVLPHKIATLDNKIVVGKIGVLNKKMLEQVVTLIKDIF